VTNLYSIPAKTQHLESLYKKKLLALDELKQSSSTKNLPASCRGTLNER